jgi:flagellar biosynthesis/type III secretory pathway M-ring protein FliF/YscJ
MNVQKVQHVGTQAGQDIWDKVVNNSFTTFMIKLAIAVVVVIFLLVISKIISSTVRKKIVNRITLQDEEYVVKIGKLVEDVIFYSLALFSLFLGADIVGLDVGLLL